MQINDVHNNIEDSCIIDAYYITLRSTRNDINIDNFSNILNDDGDNLIISSYDKAKDFSPF